LLAAGTGGRRTPWEKIHMNTRSFGLAVLIAGAVMALLGNLPIVNLVNCLLCIWVWLGGGLAVLTYRRLEHGQPGPSGPQGAGLGAVSGLIGAALGFGVFLLTAAISTPIMENLARALKIEGDMPFGSASPGGSLGGALIFLVLDLVLYPLFGALGGLITANIARSRDNTPNTT
jgi:hypothetical protein